MTGGSPSDRGTGAGSGARSRWWPWPSRRPGSAIGGRRRIWSPLAAALVASAFVLLYDPVVVAQKTARPASGELGRHIDLLARVVAIVRDRHVSKPGPRELIETALTGLVEGIDPDAELLPPGSAGQGDGDVLAAAVGIVPRREPQGRRRGGGIRIVATSDDSPAARAGLKANDLLTAIDDEPTSGLSIPQALRKLDAGQPASRAVRLTVQRDNGQPLSIALVRERSGPDVVASELAGDVIHLKIGRFTSETAREVVAALHRAAPNAPAGGDLRIVLDLRNAAAGRIEHAAAVANEFIGAGAIVAARSRVNALEVMATATGRGQFQKARLAVVVDTGTAMAGEVLAAALQANGRAPLIGLRTLGRAFSRSEVRVIGAAQVERIMLLPTRRFVTSTGAQIHGKGLAPDHAVDYARIEPSCRSTDLRESGDTPCRRRTPAEDLPLLRAMAILTKQTDAATR